MSELTAALWSGFKLAYLFGMSFATAAFFTALIWRWMKWSPINITVNVYHTNDQA